MAEYRMMILTVIFAFPFLYTIFLFKTQFNKTKEAVKSMRRSTNSFNFEEGKNLQKTKNDSQNDFVIA